MKKHIRTIRMVAIFILAFFHLTAGLPARSPGNDKQVVGWVEYVTILPQHLRVKAKLDTGAKNSSLNAVNVIEFERAGVSYVQFDLTNWKGRTETLEARVIRTAKIKQHNSKPERRPVIKLGICLGRVYREVEVNLVDRSNFNYQLLIGRSFMSGEFAVDPAKTFSVETDCQKMVPNE